MDWEALAIRALSKLPISSVAQVFEEARTRGNLHEDVKAIRDLVDMGLVPAEFQGTVMNAKFKDDFDSATASETARLVANLLGILDKAKSVDTASELAAPSDEFMYRWVHDACNESDETLQDMWARVLTGEMARSGAISRHTHAVVRELTPDVAGKFRTLCSYAMCSTDGKRPLGIACLTPTAVMTDSGDMFKNYGLHYGEFLDLAEYRLLSIPLDNSYTLPVDASGTRGYSFLLGDEVWVLGIPPANGMDSVSFPCIRFSSAGGELFPVVERFVPNDYMDALEDYFKNTWGFSVQRSMWPLYPPDKFAPR